MIPAAEQTSFSSISLNIPDIDVVDQDGRKLKFYSDLVKGRTVAINFVFTSCKTICPLLTATFADVQSALRDRLGNDLALISISLAPEHDSPPALKAYAQRFGAKPGWTFVTGKLGDIAVLLKALNASIQATDDHTAISLIGNDAHKSWTRASGLSSAAIVADVLRQSAGSDATNLSTKPAGAASSYFTNLPLLDQNGRKVHFYDDVLRDRLVLIVPFYTSCSDECPVAIENLRRAESLVRSGLDVRLIAISVNADTDRPEKLRTYANVHELDEKWTLLTGKKENVDWVLHKLGLYVEDPAEHDTRILIGRENTGNWLKLMATSEPSDIARGIETIAAVGTTQ